jgi:chemotaxis protein MotB
MAAGGGGSWKVAYADFVTAMMALFIVLWVLNQNQQVKGLVEEYFKNPWKATLSDSTGIIPIKNADVTTSRKANFEAPSAVELNAVRRVNEDLTRTFLQQPEFRDSRSLEIELTPEGLLINFLDRPNEPIFKQGTAEFTDWGRKVMGTVAWLISRYDTTEVELEGHTEKGFKPVRENYGSWEISVDRGNAARRKLIEHGVKESQVVKVAGYGGTKPLKGNERKPDDPSNSRVSIMLRGGKSQGAE